MTEKALAKKLHEIFLSAPTGSDLFVLLAKFMKREIKKEKANSYRNGKHSSNI